MSDYTLEEYLLDPCRWCGMDLCECWEEDYYRDYSEDLDEDYADGD